MICTICVWHDFQDLWVSVEVASMLAEQYFDHFARLGLARPTIVLSQYVGKMAYCFSLKPAQLTSSPQPTQVVRAKK